MNKTDWEQSYSAASLKQTADAFALSDDGSKTINVTNPAIGEAFLPLLALDTSGDVTVVNNSGSLAHYSRNLNLQYTKNDTQDYWELLENYAGTLED